MTQGALRNRAGFTLVELLLASTVGITVACLVVIGLAGFPNRGQAAPTDNDVDTRLQTMDADASRIRCSNNLRQIGIAMISFDTVNNGFPSDKNTNFENQSFYTQLLDNLELGELAPKGKPNPKGVAKPFVCPGRRTADRAPGACDYGYVQTSGATSLSVLDAVGTGVMGTTISNAAGTQNTAVLSHFWLPPGGYGKAEPGWAQLTGHSVAHAKGSRGYDDRDSTGAGAMGSPHQGGMPCVFADGHVGILKYNHPQFRDLWNYSNTTVELKNVP